MAEFLLVALLAFLAGLTGAVLVLVRLGSWVHQLTEASMKDKHDNRTLELPLPDELDVPFSLGAPLIGAPVRADGHPPLFQSPGGSSGDPRRPFRADPAPPCSPCALVREKVRILTSKFRRSRAAGA